MSTDSIVREGAQAGGNKSDAEHGSSTVEITINGVNRTIHRGHQTVAAIKTVGGVPMADDLSQVVDNKLVLLDDNGGVTIKGQEVFVSSPKSGASS